MHLTNYSINKSYVAEEGAAVGAARQPQAMKWKLSEFWRYLGSDADTLKV
jgi:hypothetical protein